MFLGDDLLRDVARHRLVLLEATRRDRDPGAPDRDQAVAPVVGLETAGDLDLWSEGVRDRVAVLLRCKAPHRHRTAPSLGRLPHPAGGRKQDRRQ